jgi:large subunit ribosomal protein L30
MIFMEEKIIIVRVRGEVGVRKSIKDTLKMLNLHKKNWCVIVPKTRVYLGMINKVKDYVTYGPVTDEVLKSLDEKRKDGDKKFYRLNPPRGGFGRKGVKKPFSVHGALGFRGVKINDLIKRML